MSRFRRRKFLTVAAGWLAIFAIGLWQNGFSQGTNWCYGIPSYGNPYPCCEAGNCTWWAWKMANEHWEDPIPAESWHMAYMWADSARRNHYGVDSVPVPGTIGVNTTARDRQGNLTGHVAWVTNVDSQWVYVTEMNCHITQGVRSNRYAHRWFNGGYIYPKPRVHNMNPPVPVHSPYNQRIDLYGRGFKPNARVRVTFPNHGQAVLSGSQVIFWNPTILSLNITFGTSGWYGLEILNNDGGGSVPYWHYVP